jgi:ABC-type protease/lipase transport system fused ATPase/permease subunit
MELILLTTLERKRKKKKNNESGLFENVVDEWLEIKQKEVKTDYKAKDLSAIREPFVKRYRAILQKDKHQRYKTLRHNQNNREEK